MSVSATSTSPSRSPATSNSGATRNENTYTVQRGDNLSHIAKQHDVKLNDLIAANPQIRNPNLIHPGQEINIPSGSSRGGAAPVEAGPRHTTLSSGQGPRPPTGGLSPETLRAGIESTNALRRGANGPQVETLQRRLTELGHSPGPVDGVFGQRTHDAVRAFQRSQSLAPDGVVGPKTQAALQNPQEARPISPNTPGSAPNLQVYEPGSPEARALFRDAARMIGVPESWADSAGLHNILRRESGGRVGVPNYTYGARANDPSRWGEVHDELRSGRITARSSATGLGQLLLDNVDRHYPNGRAGIGDPVQEAAGMLSYIRERYGNPDNAWRLYGTRHEGY